MGRLFPFDPRNGGPFFMFPNIFGDSIVYQINLSANDVELIKGLALWALMGFLYLCSRCSQGFTVTVHKADEPAGTGQFP
jgi:hypothetical protein